VKRNVEVVNDSLYIRIERAIRGLLDSVGG
jgi:hypothetical protein